MPKQENPPARDSRTSYPFPNCADGQWWLYRRGEDFGPNVKVGSVRSAAYMWARRKGYKAEVRVESADEVYIRFTPRSAS